MASIIDRLMGRTETAPAVVELAPEAKAVTGPGAYALANFPPLHSMSKDPNRLMAEAQALFHTNGWVAAAERALGGKFIRMGWHLEDEDGETVDDTFPEPYQAVLRLLERPSHKARYKLWGITFRHLGLTGNAFWYLDQREGLAGTPLEILYINPARMTPVLDEGTNVRGWILDAPGNPVSGQQGRPGVPMATEEVIHFTMDEPDWGIWGIGIAESAQRKIELDRLADVHAGGVLASGGRLTGLIAPKEGVTVNDDQWVQFVNDYRRITEDPDAAKRLQIAKMPLDFTQMTASPKDLQLMDVTAANRDTIMGLWGVPKGQRGLDTPAGLNSDRAEGDESTIWETTKERSEPFRESVQIELLDRWQALGVNVKLILDYPTFDENEGQFENASLARTIPMTVDQRLAQVGMDPLDPAVYGTLGQAIFIDQSMVRVDTLDPPPTPVTLPPAPDPQPTDSTSTNDEEEVVEDAVKADLTKPLLGLRSEVQTTWEPKIRKAVQKVLDLQKADVLRKTDHLLRKPKETSWWSEARENKRMLAALEPLVTEMAEEVSQRTASIVKKPAKADPILNRILDYVRKQVGERITGINRTTREKVQAAVAQGVEQGMGAQELGDLISASAAFDDYRSELIARTETASAYNDSAIRSYAELDVTEVEAIDGDDDPECADRNGRRFPVDEALSITDHPNGTLDWVPVL